MGGRERTGTRFSEETAMRARIVVAMPVLVVGLVLFASCGGEDSRAPATAGSPAVESDSTGAPTSTGVPAPDTVPRGAHRPEELDSAARAVIAFLRGDGDFERIRLADTVTLQLSPEGGGTRRRVARAALRDRASWAVRSGDLPNAPGASYSLAPPTGAAALTTRVGRHLKCRESPLSSIDEELARLPHVGTMLMFDERGGCLSSWNLTLVFDPGQKPPTLVAAVYDQWEW
jgi:hypothetical protein